MDRALIIGCGYTGSALARRLTGRGVSVIGTSTAPGAAEGALRQRRLDLLEEGPLELPEACGAVVYYMVSTLFRDDRGSPHLRPMERCLSALAEATPRALVYLSSTSVYGDRQGAWVDEGSPLAPASPWARMRVDLEQLVWGFGRAHGVPACVTRLPEIYGPGRGPVARLRQGHVVRFPERYSNRIHIADLVHVLDTLGERPEVPLLLVADDEPARTLEVYRYAAAQLGLPPPRTTDEAPAGDANRLALQGESKRVRNASLHAWLGAPLAYPSYREGITAILAAERTAG